MPHEEAAREVDPGLRSVPDLIFPRQTLVSLLVFASPGRRCRIWRRRSGFRRSPSRAWCGSPKAIADHHADRHRRHAGAGHRRADRLVRARPRAGDGDVPLRSAGKIPASDDPHPDGGAGRVLDFVRGAVVSRRRIPHRLRAGRGLRPGVPGRHARRHARRAARTASHDAVVPADHAAVFRQADAAGDRADHLHELEGQYQPGDPRRHHRRTGRRGDRHRPSIVGGAGTVLGRRRVRLDASCWSPCCSCSKPSWRGSRRACCGGAHERPAADRGARPAQGVPADHHRASRWSPSTGSI